MAPVRTRKHAFGALLAAMMATATPLGASAQDFPSRPITLVVGLGAGGGTDTSARLYADAISRITGKTMVVENRPGAGGGIAANHVQRAKPDGYTLLVISGLEHSYVPLSQPGMYDAVKGFSPISLIFELVSTLAVPANSPVRTPAEFIAYARKKAGGLSLGSPGVGSPPHFFAGLIAEATGAPVQVVQYRGSTTIMTDLVGGSIDAAFPSYAVGEPFFKTGKIRPIAVASQKRWSASPNIPTLLEAGLVREMVAMWFGVVAPAGLPAPLQQQLNHMFVTASHDPELLRRMIATGNRVETSTPEEMHKLMVAENTKVAAVMKRLNMK